MCIRDRWNLSLLSIQEVIVPQVLYQISLSTKTTSENQSNWQLAYDPLVGKLVGGECPSCKQNKRWTCCQHTVPHVECENCGSIRICIGRDENGACEKLLCETHGAKCDFDGTKCNRMSCETHKHICQYCNSDRSFCDRHIYLSYEDEFICDRCSTQCQDCDRLFPPSLCATCHVCEDEYCKSHIETCPTCDKPHCKMDGKTPVGHQDTHCTKCLNHCSKCDPAMHYLQQDLVACTTCDDQVCSCLLYTSSEPTRPY